MCAENEEYDITVWSVVYFLAWGLLLAGVEKKWPAKTDEKQKYSLLL